MDLWIDNVQERDLDILLYGLISSEPSALSLFLGEEASCASIVSIRLDTRKKNSMAALTVIVEYQNKRIAVLIADTIMDVLKDGKIEEFKSEGKHLLSDGRANKFICCVISSKNYIEKNHHLLADLVCVSYESIREHVKENPFLDFMFTRAIEERKITYSEKKNRKVINFWNKYYAYVKRVFPDLRMKRFSEKSGFQSTTVTFMTKIPGMTIYHKSEEGIVDVMVKLRKYTYAEFSEAMKPYLFDGMTIKQSRTNALFSMDVPVINFGESFEEQIPKLSQALEAVVEMQEFMNELDYGRMEQILMGDSAVVDFEND